MAAASNFTAKSYAISQPLLGSIADSAKWKIEPQFIFPRLQESYYYSVQTNTGLNNKGHIRIFPILEYTRLVGSEENDDATLSFCPCPG